VREWQARAALSITTGYREAGNDPGADGFLNWVQQDETLWKTINKLIDAHPEWAHVLYPQTNTE